MNRTLLTTAVKRVVLVAMTAAVLASCNSGSTTKNGDNNGANVDSACEAQSEDKVEVVRCDIPFAGEFSQVTSICSLDIYFTQGECRIMAEGPKSLVQLVKVSVDSGSLMITYNSENNPSINMFDKKGAKVTLYVSAPKLRIASTCGTGNFIAKGTIETEDLSLGTLSSGNIEMDSVVCHGAFRYDGKNVGNAMFHYLKVDGDADFVASGDGNINAGVDIGGHVLINQNGSGRTILQGKADNTEILAFGKSNVELNIETNNVEVSAYDDANIVLAGSYKSRTVNQGKGAKVLFS